MDSSLSSIVYSRILEYLDITPVNKVSEKEYESQHHWLKRLQDIDNDFSYVGDINYKAIYMMLAINKFDIDVTFIKACQQDLTNIASYLSSHSSKIAREQCIERTTDSNMADVVDLDEDQIPRILLGISADRAMVSAVLRKAGSVNTLSLTTTSLQLHDQYSLLLNSPSSDIIAEYISDELMKEVANLGDRKSSVVFDGRGYIYPIDVAIEFDLDTSVHEWLALNPSSSEARSKLIASIVSNAKVGQLLLKHLNNTIDKSLVDFAIKSDNYHVLSLLPHTSVNLSLAITLGKVNSVRALLDVANYQHLRQATNQRKVDIRKLMESHLNSD